MISNQKLLLSKFCPWKSEYIDLYRYRCDWLIIICSVGAFSDACIWGHRLVIWLIPNNSLVVEVIWQVHRTAHTSSITRIVQITRTDYWFRRCPLDVAMRSLRRTDPLLMHYTVHRVILAGLIVQATHYVQIELVTETGLVAELVDWTFGDIRRSDWVKQNGIVQLSQKTLELQGGADLTDLRDYRVDRFSWFADRSYHRFASTMK